MTPDQEINRGQIAQHVLDNDVYKEAYSLVRAGIIQAWESAPIRDKDGQGELKLMLKLLTDVHKNMESVMTTGKLAKIQVERESLFKSTVRRFR